MTGFHSWGQWHRRNDTGDHIWHNQPHQNLRIQYLGITIADGSGSPHAGMAMIPANAFKEEVQFGNAAFTVTGAQRGADGVLFAIPMTRFIVFRGNKITGTNTGIGLGLSYESSELVVESNDMLGMLDPQTFTKGGSAAGPIAYGPSMIGVTTSLRNNTLEAMPFPLPPVLDEHF